jgi:hypothetical protein
MKNILRFVVPLAFLATLIDGCTENPVDSVSSRLVTGTRVQVMSEAAPPSGGLITVDTPGGPLDGLEIDVLAGAYDETRTFTISYAPVEKSELGPNYNLLSPLITISNGGGYSDKPMILTIPVTVPDGHFAMAFLYDPRTGELEGMPLLESTSDHVTVMTRHFSQSTVSTLGRPTATSDGDGESQIIMTSIEESKLTGNYDSRFRPGVDDWQFENSGSHVETSGQCEGQSISAMYYYTHRKSRGQPPLFGRYDNDGERKTPGLWQDDVLGYTLANVLQGDRTTLNVGDLIGLIGQKFILTDVATYNAFRYNMLDSKKPMLIGIESASGSQHAMLVYEIRGNELLVADPNFPGDTRRVVDFNPGTGEFETYHSGPNARDLGVPYSSFFYLGLYSLVNGNMPAKRWRELDNGTIGKETFPDYQLVALNDKVEFAPLVDDFKVRDGRLSIAVRNIDFAYDWSVFDETGREMKRLGTAVQLPAGRQRIGVYVTGNQGLWLGFKWIWVESQAERPRPGPFVCAPAVELSVDGAPKVVDDTELLTSFDGTNGLFSLRATNSAEDVLDMYVYDFKGEGTWTIRASGDNSAYWREGKTWSVKDDVSGTLTVTKWRNDSLDATFTFKAKASDNSEVTVTGRAWFPK